MVLFWPLIAAMLKGAMAKMAAGGLMGGAAKGAAAGAASGGGGGALMAKAAPSMAAQAAPIAQAAPAASAAASPMVAQAPALQKMGQMLQQTSGNRMGASGMPDPTGTTSTLHNRVGGGNTPMAVAPTPAPPQPSGFNQAISGARDFIKEFGESYMEDQTGINPKNPPKSFKEGFETILRNQSGMQQRGSEKEDRLMASPPNSGKLSDFIGTIKDSERKEKRRPY